MEILGTFSKYFQQISKSSCRLSYHAKGNMFMMMSWLRNTFSITGPLWENPLDSHHKGPFIC